MLTTREMEQRLVKMRDDIALAPNDEQRAAYMSLWLDWCEASGLPADAKIIARVREKAGQL